MFPLLEDGWLVLDMLPELLNRRFIAGHKCGKKRCQEFCDVMVDRRTTAAQPCLARCWELYKLAQQEVVGTD